MGDIAACLAEEVKVLANTGKSAHIDAWGEVSITEWAKSCTFKPPLIGHRWQSSNEARLQKAIENYLMWLPNPSSEDRPLIECDVNDQVNLERYRSLRSRWITWLSTNPYHSIWTQIFSMIDDDLAVLTIAEAANHDSTSGLHNPLVSRMILSGHRDGQVLAIRRLMERTHNVISLQRLLTEIKRHSGVFTRENYVSGYGLPYAIDVNPNSQDAEPRSSPDLPGSAGMSWESDVGRNILSQIAHSSFDRLARILPERRSRSDCIPAAFFTKLQNHIDNSGVSDVLQWSHEFLAHAGDSDSVGWRSPEVTPSTVTAVQKSIVQVTHLISELILQGASLQEIVPVAQYDRFRGLDRLVNSDALEKAREKWSALAQDRNGWVANAPHADTLSAIGWS